MRKRRADGGERGHAGAAGAAAAGAPRGGAAAAAARASPRAGAPGGAPAPGPAARAALAAAAAAGARAAAAGALVALPAAALHDRTLVADGALAAYAARHLLPLCVASAAAFGGSATKAHLLGAAARGAICAPAVGRHVARVAAWRPVALGFAALVRAQRDAVASRLASLLDSEAESPAWRALAAQPAPAEEEFRTLYTMHSVGDAAIAEIVRESGDDPCHPVWSAEGHRGHGSSLELAAAGSALLAQAKMGPLRGYLQAAALLLELLAGYTHDIHAVLTLREAWLLEAQRMAAAAAAPDTPPAPAQPPATAVPAAQQQPAQQQAAQQPAAQQAAQQPAPAATALALTVLPHPCTAAAAAAGAFGAVPPMAAGASAPAQQQLPGSHFLRLWQSLLYHGVRPGLTAL